MATAAQSVLRYWREVEFFRPFSLDEIFKKHPRAYRLTLDAGNHLQTELTLSHLALPHLALSHSALPLLPWNDYGAAKLNPEYLYAFDLFIGVFPTSNALQVVSKSVKGADRALPDYRAWELPGLSCVARVTITSTGKIAADDLRISTLPWAVELMHSNKLRTLQAFDLFADVFRQEVIKIAALSFEGDELSDQETIRFPSAEEIAELCRLPRKLLKEVSAALFEQTELVGVIVPHRLKRRSVASEVRLTTQQMGEDVLSEAPAIDETSEDLSEEVTAPPGERLSELAEIDEIRSLSRRRKVEILNSFFLRDLERGHETIGSAPRQVTTLDHYLDLGSLDLATNKRFDMRALPLDLQSSPGSSSSQWSRVREQLLEIDSLRRGRWPSSTEVTLSENQRLALALYQAESVGSASAPHDLAIVRSPIIAVNGPPGTGKTTLIRELCASLVVERALALARLKTPADAFSRLISEFSAGGNRRSLRYRTLVRELSGFGIVIASSNNSAVENVSKELPTLGSLASEYRSFRYLEECTARYVKYAFGSLQYPGGPEKDSNWWGLPSLPLGKQSNRKRFIYGLLLDPRGESDEEREYRTKKLRQLTLSEWRNTTPASGKLSFKAAQRMFLQTVEELERYRNGKANKDEHFSRERNFRQSNLFLRALELQESWLREVPRLEMEFGALAQWLRRPESVPADAAASLLDLLFMISPVVSTTLASVEKMFATLGPASIGHAIIDEAGQAAPQNAVGLLLRSRRALIVGDQRQLEPVAPISPVLDEYLHKQVVESFRGRSVVSGNSVQSLVDGNAVLGTVLPDTSNPEGVWVGLPLVEHRRCEEPMFSISNQIAYGGLMQYATNHPPLPQPSLPPSSWINVKGETSGKHWVPEQGKAAMRVLRHTLVTAPSLVPFLISPFAQISDHLESMVRGLRSAVAPSLLDSTSKLVGTIHRFQGREADIVILVLGCDSSAQGAADWAGQSPNLINVAVTRAKRRLYVIGDTDLWHRRGYFSDLQKALPVVTLEQLLGWRSTSEILIGPQ